MRMATITKTVCDLCQDGTDVSSFIGTYDWSKKGAWELDLCRRCYQNRLGDLAALGRKPSKKNIRPQARQVKTTISQVNL
jgi:hypothetical protein